MAKREADSTASDLKDECDGGREDLNPAERKKRRPAPLQRVMQEVKPFDPGFAVDFSFDPGQLKRTKQRRMKNIEVTSPGLPPAVPALRDVVASPVQAPLTPTTPPKTPPTNPFSPVTPPSTPLVVHKQLHEQQLLAAQKLVELERAEHQKMRAAFLECQQRQVIQQELQAMQAAAQEQHRLNQLTEEANREMRIASDLVAAIMLADKPLWELFSSLDINKDGSLSSAEFSRAMASIGVKLSPEELMKIGLRYDTDKDGGIGFEEFATMVRDFNNKLQERFSINTSGLIPHAPSSARCPFSGFAKMRHVMIQIVKHVWESPHTITHFFSCFDVDRDGTLDGKELMAGLHKMGVAITMDELNVLGAYYDTNFNLQLDLHEFIAMVNDFNVNLQDRLRWITLSQPNRRSDLMLRIVFRTIESNLNLVDLFSGFDTDRNGLLSDVEISRGLGVIDIGISHEEAQAMIALVDSDGNGQLDVLEWVDLISRWYTMMQKFFKDTILAGTTCAPSAASTVEMPPALHRFMTTLIFRITQIGKPLVHVIASFPHAVPGSLSVAELAVALNGIGVPLSLMEAYSLVAMYDQNKDGRLSDMEVVQMVVDMNALLHRRFKWNLMSIAQRRQTVMKQIMAFIKQHGGELNVVNIFRGLDTDGNKVIDAAEFARGMELMGVSLPVGELRVLFQRADSRTRDGVLELDEFCDLIKLINDEVSGVMEYEM